MQKNPEATEVAGIPIKTFDLLIQAFYNGLSQELKITLPHNLKNPDYLETLLAKLDILLSPGIPEKVTQENLATLPEIVGLYQEHQERGKIERDLTGQQARWQGKFNQSIKIYHANLLRNLHNEIVEACPSLADKPKIVEIISRDVARTIQDQGLPAINFNYETRETIQKVTEKALQTYASEAPEIKADLSLASQIAQKVAQENEAATWETRTSQINATTTTPLWEVEKELRLAMARNLPLEIYQQNPEVVEEISRRVLGRLSLPALATSKNYQRELTQEIGIIMASTEIQKVLGSVSEETRQKIEELPDKVSVEVETVAQKWSQSPRATMAGVAAPSAPPPPPTAGPPKPYTEPSTLGDIYFSDGSPGHILSVLASPQSGESFTKWLITGGLIKTPVGFVLDTIPGAPKSDYLFDLFGPYLGSIKRGFQDELQRAQGLPPGYEQDKTRKDALAQLSMINFIESQINKRPWLNKLYQTRNFSSKIFHPLRSFQLSVFQRSLPAGVAVSSLTEILSAYVKYGGYGGAQVSEMVLKNLAMFGLKVIGHKIGFYEVVNVYPHQKYVFKPTYRLKKNIQKFVFEKFSKSAVGNAARTLLTKLGITALAGTLSGGATILLQIGWSLLKKIWKWLAGALGLFIFWLIGQLGGAMSLLLAIPGGIVGFMVGGPVGAAVGAIGLPTVAILGKGLFGSLGSALFGPGGLISSFSLPSLTGYAILAPAAFVGVGVGTMFVMIPLMSAFVDYQQTFAPIFFSDCRVDDIHKTNTITPENKAVFVAKYMALFPNSLLEKKIDEVISRSQAIGFNPALAVAIWAEESHFSNYGEKVGTGQVSEGYDFGCGVNCTENRPKVFEQSLGCFVAGSPQITCKNACLDKTDFASFMECYGPAAQNPNFISNVLSFYRDLVPGGEGTITCPGGTTSEYASSLLNALIACYDHGNVINEISFKDKGACLVSKGISQQAASIIAGSVNTYRALQCVGFAQAVEAATGGSLQQTPYGSAKYYYSRSVPGYQNIAASQKNVRVGDIAVWTGTDGHMAIVVEVASDMSWFRVAQAIGTDDLGRPYGLVNESSRQLITMPGLLGFLRRQ